MIIDYASSHGFLDSPMHHEQANVKAVCDHKELGTGTLIVRESALIWQKPAGVGFLITYPNISLHAVSSDPLLYPQKCVYLMVNASDNIPGLSDLVVNGTPPTEDCDENDSDADEGDDVADISEFIFVPSDENAIAAIYNAITECQLLNPDESQQSDDMDENEMFEDADTMLEDRMNGDGDHAVDEIITAMNVNTINVEDVHRTNDNGDNNDDIYEDAD